MADFPQGDKLIIQELEFVDNYVAAYRIKQLKKENANLKRQLTKLKNERNGKPINKESDNCAIFDVVDYVCPKCKSTQVLDWVYDDELYCNDCEHRWAN